MRDRERCGGQQWRPRGEGDSEREGVFLAVGRRMRAEREELGGHGSDDERRGSIRR